MFKSLTLHILVLCVLLSACDASITLLNKFGVVGRNSTLPSQPASFGAFISPTIQHRRVYTTLNFDPTLCFRPPPPPFTLDLTDLGGEGDGPIAIVGRRGDCTFEDKARNVLQYNLQAVCGGSIASNSNADCIDTLIIYDNINSNNLIPMFALNTTSFSNLRILSTTQSGGAMLMQSLNTYRDLYSDRQPLLEYNGLTSQILFMENSWLMAAAGAFILIMAGTCSGFVCVRVFFRRMPTANERNNRNGVGVVERVSGRSRVLLSKTEVDELVVIRYCGDGDLEAPSELEEAGEDNDNGEDDSDEDDGKSFLNTIRTFLSFTKSHLSPTASSTAALPPTPPPISSSSQTLTSTTSTMSTSTTSSSTATDHYSSPSCPICLEDYKKNEKLLLLPCNHTFHPNCIKPWLTERMGRCPLCKVDVKVKPVVGSDKLYGGRRSENATETSVVVRGSSSNTGYGSGEVQAAVLGGGVGTESEAETISTSSSASSSSSSEGSERVALQGWGGEGDGNIRVTGRTCN